MNTPFDAIISQTVEQTLDSPAFAQLTRPEYEHKKNQLNEFFHELLVYTLFNNLDESQLSEADDLDFTSPQAGQKFAQWAAEIPDFLLIYEDELKKYVEQIKLTGQIPELE